MISLEEVNKHNLLKVIQLQADSKFVAPNAQSIAEAYFSEHAWFRAIYNGSTLVGFIMLSLNIEKYEYEIWRFMIDDRFQRKGFGLEALRLVIDHVQTLPKATDLYTCVVEGEGSPKRFYEKAGFKATGEYEDSEAVMRLKL